MKIGKHHLTSIVDTGAGVSVISLSLAQKAFKNEQLPWDGPTIILADGRRVKPNTGVELSFKLNFRRIKVFAAVLDLSGADFLLGSDALAQLGQFSIDYTVSPPLLKFCNVNQEVFSCKVFNELGVSVPAQSVMFVPVAPREHFDKALDNYLFEPSKKLFLDKGLCVGKAVLRSDVSLLPITNFSNEAQWLEKGTVVGALDVIDEIDEKAKEKDKMSIDRNTHGKLGFESRVNKRLLDDERKCAYQLLEEYSHCFAQGDHDLGRVDLVTHTIETGDAQPIYQAPYASSYKQREIVKDQVENMLKNDVIEPASGPWASPIVLVKNPDGKWRFCVDYRRLNQVTVEDVYPLPRIEDALGTLEGSVYFSSLDMQSGFWQIQVKPEDRPKTAFVTSDGLYQFKVLPFGLVNSPRTFQRMMDVLLSGLKWHICLVYIDDIIVFSRTFEEHLH